VSKLTTPWMPGMQHAKAPLTGQGRLRMVLLVEDDGFTLQQAAACCNVAKSTCWEWVRRWRQASTATLDQPPQRASLSLSTRPATTRPRSGRHRAQQLGRRFAMRGASTSSEHAWALPPASKPARGALGLARLGVRGRPGRSRDAAS
jgi:transposase-like protein